MGRRHVHSLVSSVQFPRILSQGVRRFFQVSFVPMLMVVFGFVFSFPDHTAFIAVIAIGVGGSFPLLRLMRYAGFGAPQSGGK